MDEYISKHEAYKMLKDKQAAYMQVTVNEAFGTAARMIDQMKPADVQPLSVVAEHIKKRLYETAFNTTEEKARNAIADMAGRIDFWIDELKDGDAE